MVSPTLDTGIMINAKHGKDDMSGSETLSAQPPGKLSRCPSPKSSSIDIQRQRQTAAPCGTIRHILVRVLRLWRPVNLGPARPDDRQLDEVRRHNIGLPGWLSRSGWFKGFQTQHTSRSADQLVVVPLEIEP